MTDTDKAPLAGRTTVSAAWLVMARLLTKAIDFLALLVLARLLSPTQFGVVAVAMTLIYIVEAVLELPISQVLIRLKIKQSHLDTAFTLGVMRGLALTVILVAVAWPFSRIYDDPRLTQIIAILSLAPAMRALVSPRMAVYAQALNYKRDFAIELSAKAIAFVLSISAAMILRDYRALIIGTLATPATMVVLSYILAPYRPRLSLAEWPEFSQFVGWATASQVLAALNWQCDRLVLGRYVSRARLGEFSLANDLSYLPEQAIIKPIMRPLISAFSLIGDDRQRLDAAYEKTSTTILAIGAPMMIGLSLLARPTVELALGDKWLAAIPILQWLSLTLIPALFIAPLSSLAMSLGRPKIALQQTAAEAIIKLPMVFAGAYWFGVSGVIAARAVSAILTALVSLHFVRGLIGTPVTRQLLSAWRVVISGLILAALLLLLRPLVSSPNEILLALQLAIVAGIGMVGYLAAMGVCWHVAGRPGGLETAAFERLQVVTLRFARRQR